MTSTTHAIVANGSGGLETLSAKEIEVAAPAELELLIEVKASALNPVDAKARASNTVRDRVLGFDGAGVVRKLGSRVDATRFAVGDRVFWAGNIQKQGSFAGLQLVDSRIVGKCPQSIDFARAAALPLVSLTAWEPLFENLRLPLDGSESSQVVLVVGGAGGVGSAVIQIAKHVLKSETIIATASRVESADWCRKLGATHIIDHSKNLSEELKRVGVEAVDIAYCTVDLDRHYDNLIPLMRMGGAIVGITFGDATKVNPAKLFWPKRLTLVLELMFGRAIANHKPELQGAILDKIAQLVDDKLFLPIDTLHLKGLTLENVRRGMEQQATAATCGKIVIEH
jgi:NADPH:quinone reductase